MDKVTCGLPEIPKAVSNPQWDGSDSIPQYVPTTAPSGKQWCKAYLTVKNVGKVPDSATGAGNLVLGDGDQVAPVDNGMLGWTVLETELGVTYADSINPGDSTRLLEVYEVPAGSTGAGVLYPMDFTGTAKFLLKV